MFQIRPETPADIGTVNALLDAGFGPDRRQRTVYRMRQNGPVDGLCFVATDPVSDEPLATIRFYEVALGTGHRSLLLGPLAVHRDLQGLGLGRALVSHGLSVGRHMEWSYCLVSGEPDYYRPYGFVDAAPFNISMPGPVRANWLQVLGFSSDALPALGVGPHAVGPIVPAENADQPRRWVRPAEHGVSGAPNDDGRVARFAMVASSGPMSDRQNRPSLPI